MTFKHIRGKVHRPLSPQSTKINQRQACLNADLFFSALQRPAAGGEGCRSASGATKSRRGRGMSDLLADLISTSPVLFLRSGTKKAPQLGLKCLILSVKFDITCRHKGTTFSLNLKYFFKKHFNYRATPNCWASWTIPLLIPQTAAISLMYSLHF